MNDSEEDSFKSKTKRKHIANSLADSELPDNNTPGTVDGPGGRDQTMAVKRRKNAENHFFSRKKKYLKKNCIYLLVMPKYWGKQIFTHGRFPEVDEKHHVWRTQAHLDQNLFQ